MGARGYVFGRRRQLACDVVGQNTYQYSVGPVDILAGLGGARLAGFFFFFGLVARVGVVRDQARECKNVRNRATCDSETRAGVVIVNAASGGQQEAR